MTKTTDQLITLKTIYDLRLDESGQPQRYYIAAYQRGYRWSPLQVTQLLDDVLEFTKRRNPQPDHFYCLQPIVLKVAKDGGYEVVDGQQRLTTLLLILRCLNSYASQKKQMETFTLAYETRPSLDGFLAEPTQKSANSNIDYYHLFDAIDTIEKWFDDHDNEVDAIKIAFLNQTKVIWFQLADADDPVAAFTRLNVGKIPLTNDELIRALFLRRGANGSKDASDQQLRIAHEWDLIEKTLQNDAFWYFLSNTPGPSQNRIGFLFNLVAQADGVMWNADTGSYEVFYHFSERLNADDGDAEMEWRRAKQTFMVLEEWFEDRTLFHIVGFLIHTGQTIDALVKLSQGCTKDQFERRLRELVFKSVIGQIPEKMNREVVEAAVAERLESVNYGPPVHNSIIRSILLLFNVATLLQNERSNLRFQFDSFKCGEWDIEHVRSVIAQSSETSGEDAVSPTAPISIIQQFPLEELPERAESLNEKIGGFFRWVWPFFDAARTGVWSSPQQTEPSADDPEDELLDEDAPRTLQELSDLSALSIERLQEIEDALLTKQQIVLTGPPGTSKTYIAQLFARYFAADRETNSQGKHTTLFMHANWAYEDFFEGIKPFTDDGVLKFEPRLGCFLEWIESLAEYRPTSRHVLVLDEINRCDTAAVLGELLQLLEYRGRAVRLLSGRKFRFPSNVSGASAWDPIDDMDEAIEICLQNHREADHGFGPAAGLSAARFLAEQLIARKCSVSLEASDWSVDHKDREVMATLIDGVRRRALSQLPHNQVERWAATRRQQNQTGVLKLMLPHLCLLSLPQRT